MGALTTHVLDTSTGKPGTGIRFDLYRCGSERVHLLNAATNSDGRCDAPLLSGTDLTVGQYELVYQAGDHFRAQGLTLPQPAFLDQIVIRFGVSDPDQHYHVPLLLSPYGYSTYRGS